jgi:hypothetical protein
MPILLQYIEEPPIYQILEKLMRGYEIDDSYTRYLKKMADSNGFLDKVLCDVNAHSLNIEKDLMQRYRNIVFGYNNTDILKLLPLNAGESKTLSVIEKELQLISALILQINELDYMKPIVNYFGGDDAKGFKKLYLCYLITVLDKAKSSFNNDIWHICMQIMDIVYTHY